MECAYCGHTQADDYNEDQAVPSVHDDEAWEALATYHDPDCEWLTTRAHRQDANS